MGGFCPPPFCPPTHRNTKKGRYMLLMGDIGKAAGTRRGTVPRKRWRRRLWHEHAPTWPKRRRWQNGCRRGQRRHQQRHRHQHQNYSSESLLIVKPSRLRSVFRPRGRRRSRRRRDSCRCRFRRNCRFNCRIVCTLLGSWPISHYLVRKHKSSPSV